MPKLEKLHTKVNKTIHSKHLFSADNYLLLMVSGGSDSVALAYVINELVGNSRFAIMHLNHNLRLRAQHEAQFVENLANYLKVPFFSYSENIKEIAVNKNIEAVGHELRYKLANEACQK